jgi:hypothetical protein
LSWFRSNKAGLGCAICGNMCHYNWMLFTKHRDYHLMMTLLTYTFFFPPSFPPPTIVLSPTKLNADEWMDTNSKWCQPLSCDWIASFSFIVQRNQVTERRERPLGGQETWPFTYLVALFAETGSPFSFLLPHIYHIRLRINCVHISFVERRYALLLFFCFVLEKE